MKKIYYVLAIALVLIELGCANKNDLEISIKDTRASYYYTAIYPKAKTKAIEGYVNQALGQHFIFASKLDTTFLFAKQERLNLQSVPGTLKIAFDKNNSSISGYVIAKKLTAGITALLKDQQ